MQILNQFKSAYNLPDSATEQDVLAAFQSSQNKSRSLQEENEKLKQQKHRVSKSVTGITKAKGERPY